MTQTNAVWVVLVWGHDISEFCLWKLRNLWMQVSHVMVAYVCYNENGKPQLM